MSETPTMRRGRDMGGMVVRVITRAADVGERVRLREWPGGGQDAVYAWVFLTAMVMLLHIVGPSTSGKPGVAAATHHSWGRQGPRTRLRGTFHPTFWKCYYVHCAPIESVSSKRYANMPHPNAAAAHRRRLCNSVPPCRAAGQQCRVRLSLRPLASYDMLSSPLEKETHRHSTTSAA